MTDENQLVSLENLMRGNMRGTREGSFLDHTYIMTYSSSSQVFELKTRRVVRGLSFHYEATGHFLGRTNSDVEIGNPKKAYLLARERFE